MFFLFSQQLCFIFALKPVKSNTMKTSKHFVKSFFLFVLLSSSLTFISCHKDCNCKNSVDGELKNFTGLDGCGWVIVLDDGSKLEPTNLASFNVPLVDGQKISVSYHEIQAASICMVGKMVEIECLCER